MLKYIFVFLCLISCVSALQDVNLTIDNQNTDICISNSELSFYACGLNETLIVNGTSDVYLKLINKPSIPRNFTNIDLVPIFVFTPIHIIFGVSILVFSLIMGCMFLYIGVKIISKK